MSSMLRLPVGYRVALPVVHEGSPRHKRNDLSDIRESLDQLDLRLDELRRQIAALIEEPPPAAPLAPPPPHWLRSLPVPPPELIEPDLDSEPEPVSGAVLEAPGGAVPEPRPVTAEPTEPEDDPPLAPARIGRDRPNGLDVLFGRASTPAPAASESEVTSQIAHLMAVRDQLLAGTRELVRAYERQLEALGQMTSPGPEPVLSAVPIKPPEADEQARPVFFEGTVILAVSGAHRIQTIEVLQDALSRARNVDQVYVRRCHRGQVSLELTLSAGAELLGEFNRVLPFPFAVTSATGEEITVVLEGER